MLLQSLPEVELNPTTYAQQREEHALQVVKAPVQLSNICNATALRRALLEKLRHFPLDFKKAKTTPSFSSTLNQSIDASE